MKNSEKNRLEEKVSKARKDAKFKLINDCLVGEGLDKSDFVLGLIIRHIKTEFDAREK